MVVLFFSKRREELDEDELGTAGIIFIERICRRNACTSHADSCRIVVW